MTQFSNSASRRAFLGGASAAAAFTILPRHVLGGPGVVAPSAKTTLACIGLGGQGTQNMMAFLQFSEIRVVAVCDVNREGGGYLSWNWSKGQEGQTCAPERIARAQSCSWPPRATRGSVGAGRR